MYLESQLLRRLRQENGLNPGGEDCSELRSCDCTLAQTTRVKLHLKKKTWPGAVAHAYNPSTLGGEAGGSRGQRSRPFWSTRWNPISSNNTKIRWAWWHLPVIPATREGEAGELLETRTRRLRWAEIVPLHSSLGNNSETPSQKN